MIIYGIRYIVLIFNDFSIDKWFIDKGGFGPSFWVNNGIQGFPYIIHRVFVTIKNLLVTICLNFFQAFAEKIFISIIFYQLLLSWT